MHIDINAIVNNKLKEMDDNKTIEKLLAESIEKAITKGIESALDSYSLKRVIQDKVEKEVSEVVSKVGFNGYNSFIADRVKDITEGTCREDISNKIQKTFNDILVLKRESIKLSEIFKKYKECLEEELDCDEKYSLENFYVDAKKSEYGWLTFDMAKEETDFYYRSDYHIKFTVLPGYEDKKIGKLTSVTISGRDLKDAFKLGHISDIELLIANLYYNETPIIIDVESEDDIETYFDIVD